MSLTMKAVKIKNKLAFVVAAKDVKELRRKNRTAFESRRNKSMNIGGVVDLCCSKHKYIGE